MLDLNHIKTSSHQFVDLIREVIIEAPQGGFRVEDGVIAASWSNPEWGLGDGTVPSPTEVLLDAASVEVITQRGHHAKLSVEEAAFFLANCGSLEDVIRATQGDQVEVEIIPLPSGALDGGAWFGLDRGTVSPKRESVLISGRQVRTARVTFVSGDDVAPVVVACALQRHQ